MYYNYFSFFVLLFVSLELLIILLLPLLSFRCMSHPELAFPGITMYQVFCPCLLGDFCHEPAVLLQTGLVASSCCTGVVLGFSFIIIGFPLALSYVLHPYFYFSYLHSLVPHFGRASILLVS